MKGVSDVRVVVTLTTALLVVGLSTGCGARNGGSTESEPRAAATAQSIPSVHNGVEVVPPGTPCPMAVHDDPITLAAVSDSPVYWPTSGADRITQAWRCGVDSAVFMFDDIQLSFESGWENVQVPQKFEDLANDYGGSVETVQGLSAWVVPASPNSGVLMVKDGTAIRISATGDVPIADLVALAEALDLSRAVNGST